MYGWPTYGWPIHGWPIYGWPIYDWPIHGWPVYEWPTYGWPIYGWPIYGWPCPCLSDIVPIYGFSMGVAHVIPRLCLHKCYNRRPARHSDEHRILCHLGVVVYQQKSGSFAFGFHELFENRLMHWSFWKFNSTMIDHTWYLFRIPKLVDLCLSQA